MTHTENTIWRALCDMIIHAEGVPSKKMNEFRLITHRLCNLAQRLGAPNRRAMTASIGSAS